jgi:glycine betaine/choline ABC-type transport system substrate-binding protein
VRLYRMLALGVSALLLAGACATGGGSTAAPASVPAASSPGSSATAAAPIASSVANPSPAITAPPAAANSIASRLVLGGPPECPQRPFCLIGLQKVYGLTFKSFVPLDAGGPLTVAALQTGKIGIGLLFTSDPSIQVDGFVLLADDKHLQASDNLAPVIRTVVLRAHPDIATLLDALSAKLTQAQLTALNKQVTVDKTDPADVARAWLQQQGFVPTGGANEGRVVVGSTNFSEQLVLAELYAQQLEANGYTVVRKFNLGSREVVQPAIQAGQIDLYPEYLASLTEYLDKGAGLASGDPAATARVLARLLAPKGESLLAYAPATDENGFAVTRQTAQRYALVKLSDLAKPAP